MNDQELYSKTPLHVTNPQIQVKETANASLNKHPMSSSNYCRYQLYQFEIIVKLLWFMQVVFLSDIEDVVSII